MGVLDIRMRSATLGNIGGIREADVNDGSAQIAKAVSDNANVAFAIAEKEKDRLFDSYYTKMSELYDGRFNGKVNEDGTITKGALSTDCFMDGSNPDKWRKGNESYLAEGKKKIAQDLGISESQMKAFDADRRMASFYMNWKNAEIGKINRDVETNTKVGAKSRMEQAGKQFVQFRTPEAMKSYAEAIVNNLLANHIYSEDVAKAEVENGIEVARNQIADNDIKNLYSIEDCDKLKKAIQDGQYRAVTLNPSDDYGMRNDGKVSEKEQAFDAEMLQKVANRKHQLIKKQEAEQALMAKENADKLTSEIDSFINRNVDTNVLMANRSNFESADDYDNRIDNLVETKQLNRDVALKLKSSYRGIVAHMDALITSAKSGDGVWVKTKDRRGATINVFKPNKMGNGKSETDPTYAAKYTLVGRDGNTPFFNNPTKGMEELEYDLQMGNISVPFYNTQMEKMIMLSDEKAKMAFLKIFGANPMIFKESEILSFQNKGIDVEQKTIWAKNKWWAGNHDVGSSKNVSWQEDALNKDGGEDEVLLEQEAQIYELVLKLSAQGIDPTEAIQCLIAPTFSEWITSDINERLDPMSKRNGKSFFETVISSKRYGGTESPSARKSRMDERKKTAYGEVEGNK